MTGPVGISARPLYSLPLLLQLTMIFLRGSSFFLVLILAGMVAVGPSVVQAQEQPSQSQATFGPTVKEYGRSGVPKMTVYVWGNADSGVWRIEKGTTLLEFASVVSRARMTDNSPDQRRVERISIYRDQSPRSGEDPFFETRIETLFAERTSSPALQEGDILVLETRTRGRFTWRDVARVAGTIATLLNTYLLFDRISN